MLAHSAAVHSSSPTVTSVSSSKGACRSNACHLKRERTQSFVRSLDASKLRYLILGNTSSWQGWRWMSNNYAAHASSVAEKDPEHLIIAIDSSDVVSQALNEEDVVAAYRRIVAESPNRPPLVMALETGCVPGACTRIPNLPSPAVPGNFQINGGFLMGPARMMHHLWTTVATTNISCCKKGKMDPQLGMGVFALQHRELVAFDINQRLSAVINLHHEGEWATNYHVATTGIVTNRNTGVRPMFLHFPGQQFKSSWRTYRDSVLGPRGLLSPEYAATVQPVASQDAAHSSAPIAVTPASLQAMPSLLAATPALPKTFPPWQILRGSPCTPVTSRVIFTFTCTPARASRVGRVLDNMRGQSRKPDAVVLAIPRTYSRPAFNSMKFELASAVAADPLLQIVHLEHDAGPLTKYLGLQASRNPTDIVVVGDDDVWYGNTFIEDFSCAVAASPANTVISSGHDKSCEALGACVMGFRGVALRAGMLDQLSGAQMPAECFLADDVFVTHHFLVRQFVIKRLRTRTKYRIDHALAFTNYSINSIHRRAKFTLNRKCTDRIVPGHR